MEEKKQNGNTASSQSQEIQDLQTSDKSSFNSGSNGEAGSVGQETENQPIRSGGEDGQGANSALCSGVKHIGGFPNRLIEDTRNQSVKSQDCINILEDEKAEYEAKANKLQQLKELTKEQSEPVPTT